MRFLTVVLSLFLFSVSCYGQKEGGVMKILNYYFNDTADVSKPKFIIYPILGYTPETRWEFGAAGLFVYNAKNDLDNRLSEITSLAFVTLENQYGFFLDHAIYTDQNKFFLLGKFRFQQFPLLYHGIGAETPSEPVALIAGFSFAWRQRVLHRVKENFYAGLELDLNRLASVEVKNETEEFIPPPGIEGYTNFGFGLGLVYDERYNVLNPRKGLFVETGFLHYNKNIASDFSFQNYFFDFRYYKPMFKNQVFAYQFFGNAVAPFNGSKVPFNQVSLMGGENLMRGYYLGRYRDNAYLATQAEYRFLPFPFSKRFGGTIFGGLGAVSPSIPDLNLSQVRAAGGLGLRFLIFPGKDIYTRFDVAVTSEGLGYYLFVGEAF